MSTSLTVLPRVILDKEPKLAKLSFKEDRTNHAAGTRKSPMSMGWLKCEGKPTSLVLEGELVFDGIDRTDRSKFEAGAEGASYRIAVMLHNEYDVEALDAFADRLVNVPEDRENWTVSKGNLYKGAVYCKCPILKDGSKFKIDTPFDLDPEDACKNSLALVGGADVRVTVDVAAWFNFESLKCGTSFWVKSIKPFKPAANKKNKTKKPANGGGGEMHILPVQKEVEDISI